ncbi:hypothetical protein D3C79_1040770 [compost metagenome]
MLGELLGGDLGFELQDIANFQLELFERRTVTGPGFADIRTGFCQRNGFINNHFIIRI